MYKQSEADGHNVGCHAIHDVAGVVTMYITLYVHAFLRRSKRGGLLSAERNLWTGNGPPSATNVVIVVVVLLVGVGLLLSDFRSPGRVVFQPIVMKLFTHSNGNIAIFCITLYTVADF